MTLTQVGRRPLPIPSFLKPSF
jgi:hypothetical protein